MLRSLESSHRSQRQVAAAQWCAMGSSSSSVNNGLGFGLTYIAAGARQPETKPEDT